jgi:hypothetical protein
MSPAKAQAEGDEMKELQQRNYIAEILVGFSLVGLVAISMVILWRDKNGDSATLVFNNVLPLFGTWIGTVLAYYFSRSNFATAASAYNQMAKPDAALADTPVTTAMIDKAKIVGIVSLAAGQSEATINFQTGLLAKLQPPVTRIPVVDANGAMKYILHENTLNKFVTKNIAVAGFNLAAATLQTVINDPEFKKLATTFAIAAATASLADVKQKMDETPNCEDIFVTKTGQPSEEVIGWITDVTLSAHMRV